MQDRSQPTKTDPLIEEDLVTAKQAVAYLKENGYDITVGHFTKVIVGEKKLLRRFSDGHRNLYLVRDLDEFLDNDVPRLKSKRPHRRYKTMRKARRRAK